MRNPVLLVAAVLIGVATRPSAAQTAQARPQSCRVEELSRRELDLDGNDLYVEPTVLVPDSNGDVLLAGTPNYIVRRTPAGHIASQEADSILGVVLGRDGVLRPVPAPIDAHLVTGVRAVPRRNGGWHVVFGEAAPHAGTFPGAAIRLWYGVYDGKSWSGLERLPVPSGRFDAFTASDLLQRADTLAWAMSLLSPDTADPMPKGIALFLLGNGRWSPEIVPIDHGSLAAAFSDAHGLVLAVAEADTSIGDFPEPGPYHFVPTTSLVLWAREREWHRLRWLVHGRTEGVVEMPSLDWVGGNGIATWQTPAAGDRLETRAMVGPLSTGPLRTLVVDSSGRYWAHVRSSGLAGLWITEHEITPTEPGRLRLVRFSPEGNSIEEIHSLPSPFHGFFAVTAMPRGGEIVLAGPQFDEGNGDGRLRSLVIRFRVRCS